MRHFTPTDDSPREWDITFEKGTIKAVGKNGGKEVASEEFISAGAPAKIVLTTSRAKLSNSWDDVSVVTATIVDANGIPCPNADNNINFQLTGSGAIAAVDNGNILSHEPYNASQRKAYKGKAIAIVRATAQTGKITIRAEGDGLTSNDTTIEVK